LKTVHLSPEQVHLEREKIYQYIRIRRRASKIKMVNNYINEYHGIFEPRYRYEFFEILQCNQEWHSIQISPDPDTTLTGLGIFNLLSKSNYACLFAISIGEYIEQTLTQMLSDNFLQAYILAGMTSAMVEGTLEHLRNVIKAEAKTLNCQMLYRYSPGYAHWNIKEQIIICDLLQSDSIGIQINDSCFLSPQYSITGAIGLKEEYGKNDENFL